MTQRVQQTEAAASDGLTLLTVAEAHQQLRISRWMLYRLIQNGQLHTIKIGSRRLVPLNAVREFLRAQPHDEVR